MIRLLITGGRDFADRRLFRDSMNYFTRKNPLACIMQGDCSTGADAMAREWATVKGVELLRFPADWIREGRAAGPIRNGRMISEGKPDVVIWFPGGAGTRDMTRQAEKAGIIVLEAAILWGS